MDQRIERAKARHQELEHLLQDPSVIADRRRFAAYSRERNTIDRILHLDRETDRLTERLAQSEELERTADDQELQLLARQEADELRRQLTTARAELQIILDPPDPHDQRDVVIEIRAGAGGDEAALFAAELFRMYGRFAERRGWTMQLVGSSRTPLGGFKEVIAELAGEGAYRALKYENGVHRVQRIPATEKSGRVHTSTVSVVVLPEVEEEELSIDPKDIEVTATTSSGHGGQSVNTTYSAIRVVHRPTGIMVTCQDERSQKQNREKAMRILRARLLAHQLEERQRVASAARRSIIGTGDRSEKIRTYNVPQDRLTDHRIKQNFHGLDAILDGQLDPVADALLRAEADLRSNAPTA